MPQHHDVPLDDADLADLDEHRQDPQLSVDGGDLQLGGHPEAHGAQHPFGGGLPGVRAPDHRHHADPARVPAPLLDRQKLLHRRPLLGAVPGGGLHRGTSHGAGHAPPPEPHRRRVPPPRG
eukprot:402810_1